MSSSASNAMSASGEAPQGLSLESLLTSVIQAVTNLHEEQTRLKERIKYLEFQFAMTNGRLQAAAINLFDPNVGQVSTQQSSFQESQGIVKQAQSPSYNGTNTFQ